MVNPVKMIDESNRNLVNTFHKWKDVCVCEEEPRQLRYSSLFTQLTFSYLMIVQFRDNDRGCQFKTEPPRHIFYDKCSVPKQLISFHFPEFIQLCDDSKFGCLSNADTTQTFRCHCQKHMIQKV